MSQALTLSTKKPNQGNALIKPFNITIGWVKRLWWYTHAYGVIFAIIPLVFASLGVLVIWSLSSHFNPKQIRASQRLKPQI